MTLTEDYFDTSPARLRIFRLREPTCSNKYVVAMHELIDPSNQLIQSSKGMAEVVLVFKAGPSATAGTGSIQSVSVWSYCFYLLVCHEPQRPYCGGKMYYFCSPGCKESFLGEPVKYL